MCLQTFKGCEYVIHQLMYMCMFGTSMELNNTLPKHCISFTESKGQQQILKTCSAHCNTVSYIQIIVHILHSYTSRYVSTFSYFEVF